jgi:hypothetical protein
MGFEDGHLAATDDASGILPDPFCQTALVSVDGALAIE